MKKAVVSVTEFDENGNKIHYKETDGYESWFEYDEDGNLIHYKNKSTEIYESWSEYVNTTPTEK